MVPITGRESSFIDFLKLQSQSKLNPNPIQSIFLLFFLPVSKANLSCVVATIFSSLDFSFFVRLHGQHEPFGSYQSCFSFLVHLHGQTEPFCSCIILQSCSSFFFRLHGQPEVFVRDHLLQSQFSLQLIFVTLLQSFKSGQALFLVIFCF